MNVFVFTESGRETDERLRERFPGLCLHGFSGRVRGAERAFADAGAAMRSAFGRGEPVVGFCAAGIVIRALAPLLSEKTREPPVVAIGEHTGFVVPLLGGHRGANRLARELAGCLGFQAAATTAGEGRLGVALDAPPSGWVLANPGHYKRFAAELLAGEAVRSEPSAAWLRRGRWVIAQDARLTIEETVRDVAGSPACLVYHPKRLALGVGCARDTEPEELARLVRDTLAEHGLSPRAVAGVFSLDLKSDEPAMHALAGRLGVPARFFDAATLERQTPRLATPSVAVFREVGCHGVAEGAALEAAGEGAKLIVSKRKSRRATCAVAEAPAPIDPSSRGQCRGELYVVGLGPGDERWRSPEADAALARAEALVGYRGYLDLVAPVAPCQVRHPFPLGQEVQRVEAALTLAASGRRVALVCSGDPGVFAMASLVFERLDAVRSALAAGMVDSGNPGWLRVAVEVMPGISAMQGAAARAGAPLGHDFCVISLSDLLTPWPVIERRLTACAEGDFVAALYNPRSQRRVEPLSRAVEILRAHRLPTTPVVVGRNVGRKGERMSLHSLSELPLESTDMSSVVIVGASTTRVSGSHVYTPRGYRCRPGDGALP